MDACEATRRLSEAEARAEWEGLLDAVGRQRERVMVERSGRPVAAVISFRDFEWFLQQLVRWEEGTRVLDATGEAFKDVPVDELEREVARALAEVRAEMRAEWEQAARTS